MKKFLLEQRWVGLGLVVLFSLFVAWFASTKTILFVKTVTPYVAEEAKAFLPVTIENGTIVEPANAVISKEYAMGDASFKIELNTEVDELSSDAIKDAGFYASRKFMYAVSPQKTEIRSLSDFPNLTIDEELFNEGVKFLESKTVGGYLFAAIFLMLLIYIGIAVLLYAALTQLLVGKVVSADFTRTVRITTLGYLFLTILELLTGLNINILIKFVTLVILNYYINKNLYYVEK